MLGRIAQTGEFAGTLSLPVAVADPLAMTFDDPGQRLLVLLADSAELVEVATGPDGLPDPTRQTRVPASGFGVEDAAGLAVDPDSGRLFILDTAAPAIVVVEPDATRGFRNATVSSVALDVFLPGQLRGLAFDPTSGRLHALGPAEQRLYELTDTGRVTANRDLSGFALRNPQAMVFAPSGDRTDDPGEHSLYVAEAGGGTTGPTGRISELSLIPVPKPPLPVSIPTTGSADPLGPLAGASSSPAEEEGRLAGATETGTLIQTIDTSLFSPPSPDAAGIAYMDSTDSLLMSDSEVNEMAIYAGANLFEVDYGAGTLIRTGDTTAYSSEPTGVAWDPVSDLVFMSDDVAREVWVVDPGSDGIHGNGDDVVTSFDTNIFGSGDPEGITFDRVQGFLYLVDGVNDEVYEIDPGPNGVFDGVPSTGDDVVTSFDTQVFGANDPEGIAYDTDGDVLYLIGDDDVTLYHVTKSGALSRTIDFSAAGAGKASGLAYGPSSVSPGENNVYITDRRVDNDSDPNENDGKIYEISVPDMTPGNTPPVVDAGPDDTVAVTAVANLDGTVSDDGIPGGPLTTLWSHVSGAGSVVFGDASAVDTTASFSTAGTYVLQLAASDGELGSSDQVTITVTGSLGEIVIDVPVTASSDDAEERASGSMRLSSTDLELVFDGGGNQTVGMRFNGISVPRGSTVLNAYVQFQADEVNSEATSLVVEGEDIDDAPTFVDVNSNVSSRTRTSAQVPWSPVPWDTVGEAGPDQRTPDISSVIEEIVARAGWNAGQSLVVIVSGSGERVAESVDGAAAPVLHLEYLPNEAPAVTITAPADGSSEFENVSVGFTGTASDAEDGDLTAGLAWTSSLDGAIGSGGSFSRSDLSVGVHTITASVTDSGGLQGSDQITLTIDANTAPVVTITAPADGSSEFENVSVGFTGTASDTEDGDLTAGLAWTSSIDGSIGSGGSFSRSDLTVGVHTITASVTDAGLLQGSDQITLTIEANTAPTVTITAPADGSSEFENVSVGFTGTASDTEDGDLTAGLAWTSSIDGSIGSGGSFSRSDLTVGVHTITASVTDAGLLQGSDQITLTIEANTAPTVTILSPPDQSSFVEEQPVLFTGTASDTEDGDLTAGLAWTSSIDGAIGSGGSFARSDLSIGVHTITAAVTDAGLLEGSDQIMLTVTGNTAPVVTITAPADGSSEFEGVSVGFAATAEDAEEGDLAGDLAWTSSIDGAIGSGGSFARSDLSVGVHTITAAVTDAGGLQGSDEITLTIEANTAPTVTITAPADGSSEFENVSVDFTGTASDTEDGDLTAGLAWTSSLDGSIGSGGSFSRSDLTVGVHTITASVTDAGLLQGSDQITLTIDANTAPVVTITAPADASSEAEGVSVGFTGTANDGEDGDLTAGLAWTSSIDGSIGSGGSFSRSDLSAGIHTITASVTDAGLLEGTDQITLTIEANTAPTVTITMPDDDSKIAQGTWVRFTGTANDAEEGDLTMNLIWTSDLDGPIGFGNSFALADLTVGVHAITASATDGGGLEGSDQIGLTILAPAVPALPGWGVLSLGAALLVAARRLGPKRSGPTA